MNCRRTRSLLSAYVDAELTGFDMLQIRDHISRCADCNAEHASLVALKRLLSALPDKEPRQEFVLHLQSGNASRSLDSLFSRFMPLWPTSSGASGAAQAFPVAGRRVAAACLFGLVGAWFILAPTAIMPQSQMLSETHNRAARLLRDVGFRGPYSFSGLREASIVDPLMRGASQDARLQAIQVRMLAETRAESLNMMTQPTFDSSFGRPPEGPGNFNAPNIVLTGYSEPSH